MVEQRAVLEEVRLRLLELRLQRAAIDFEQRVALVHFLAFPEMHGDDLPVDARLHGHRREGLDIADRAQPDRDALRDDGRNADRDRRGGLGQRRAGTGREPEGDGRRACDQQQTDDGNEGAAGCGHRDRTAQRGR